MIPYTTLSEHFRARFGRRVQKIPLDAGFSCPNRDGTLSRTGCVFCNERGSGSGLGPNAGKDALSLAAQWEHWRAIYARKFKNPLFMAYLQSFSNTYGPVAQLAAVLAELTPLPDLAGLSVGTRPDCVDAEKIALLAAFRPQNADHPHETWLELGLQSSSDATLKRINRGHTAEDFARAARLAADAGLLVCAHVIAGLPGETEADFLATVRFVNDLPVAGIKFHNLYVCKGTPLAAMYERGDYTPLTREAYVAMLAQALGSLRPDIVVHRLTGDPAPGELLAPAWAADKRGLLNGIEEKTEG